MTVHAEALPQVRTLDEQAIRDLALVPRCWGPEEGVTPASGP